MKKFMFSLFFILFVSQSIFAEIEIRCSNKWHKHQISDKGYFELCYIDDLKLPEYVYWNLTCDETQDLVSRKDSFKEDKDIPLGTALPSDYLHSGYDKGHMAPVDDFKFSKEAMESTFLMSNIVPQLPSFNRFGAWRESEMQGEIYAVNYGDVDIVTGPIIISTSSLYTIGNKNTIVIPAGFFKIFYNKEIGLKEAYIIYQNDCNKRLDDYKTSVKNIENITGLRFIFK